MTLRGSTRYQVSFFAGGFEHVPSGFGEIDEVVEFARAAQPKTSINHHAFAVNIFREIAEQKSGEIGELFVAAEALHRVILPRAFFEFLRGHQTRPRAFGGKWAGSDCVHANVIAGPFDGEGARHREDSGL